MSKLSAARTTDTDKYDEFYEGTRGKEDEEQRVVSEDERREGIVSWSAAGDYLAGKPWVAELLMMGFKDWTNAETIRCPHMRLDCGDHHLEVWSHTSGKWFVYAGVTDSVSESTYTLCESIDELREAVASCLGDS